MIDLILFSILICLAITYIAINYKDKKYYRELIEIEKLISRFSNARMDIMEMLHSGETTINTCFFKCLLSATSYSIKALYLYKDKNKAVENVSIVTELAPYFLSKQMKNEFGKLNYEQQKIFYNVVHDVVKIYLQKRISGR